MRRLDSFASMAMSFEDENESFYDVLGVAPDVSPRALTAAYRARARAAHPDKAGGSAAAFARVGAAYAVLSDAARRSAYDRERRERAMVARVGSVVDDVDLVRLVATTQWHARRF